jgi:error-prone DNA polymerase
MSFALLVYASAWFKCYYPAAFCAGLLRAQPMGFYSPQSLVADARQHGVVTHRADINLSDTHATLEPDPASAGGIRLIGDDLAEAIVAERDTHGPFTDIGDLGYRTTLTKPALEALATAGALGGLATDRRDALWSAGAAAQARPAHLPGIATGLDAPALPGMTAVEVTAADLWATGVSADVHPMQYLRDHLTARGALTIAAVAEVEDGTRIWVGGAVTHRQRPGTAGGITFLNLEDETGMLNIVVSQGLWRRARQVALGSSALLVRGIVQAAQGVVSVNADQLETIDLRGLAASSRDFR